MVLFNRFHFPSVFVAVLFEVNQILDQLITQLVWYTVKQLFTSVSVKVVNSYLTVLQLSKYLHLFTITLVLFSLTWIT